jgi:hypothetical protein
MRKRNCSWKGCSQAKERGGSHAGLAWAAPQVQGWGTSRRIAGKERHFSAASDLGLRLKVLRARCLTTQYPTVSFPPHLV